MERSFAKFRIINKNCLFFRASIFHFYAWCDVELGLPITLSLQMGRKLGISKYMSFSLDSHCCCCVKRSLFIIYAGSVSHYDHGHCCHPQRPGVNTIQAMVCDLDGEEHFSLKGRWLRRVSMVAFAMKDLSQKEWFACYSYICIHVTLWIWRGPKEKFAMVEVTNPAIYQGFISASCAGYVAWAPSFTLWYSWSTSI